MTINTMTPGEFGAWRTGCDPLYIDACGDRVFVHIEPDADISAAYEAIQHVFERLLSFEVADV